MLCTFAISACMYCRPCLRTSSLVRTARRDASKQRPGVHHCGCHLQGQQEIMFKWGAVKSPSSLMIHHSHSLAHLSLASCIVTSQRKSSLHADTALTHSVCHLSYLSLSSYSGATDQVHTVWTVESWFSPHIIPCEGSCTLFLTHPGNTLLFSHFPEFPVSVMHATCGVRLLTLGRWLSSSLPWQPTFSSQEHHGECLCLRPQAEGNPTVIPVSSLNLKPVPNPAPVPLTGTDGSQWTPEPTLVLLWPQTNMAGLVLHLSCLWMLHSTIKIRWFG